MTIVTCPVCGSPQIVVDLVVDEVRPVSCTECDATWDQRGRRQLNVKPGKLRGIPPRDRTGLVVFPMKED
jgi:hypothetical protein